MLLLAGCRSANPTAPGEDAPSTDEGSGRGKVQVKVVNRLFSPVQLTQGGRPLGTVSRLDSLDVSISSASGEAIGWEMEPVRNASGAVLGETVSGAFSPPAPPGAVARFEITNVSGGEKYFAILLGNSTSAELMAGINMGLAPPENQWEKKCYCPLPPKAPLTYIGYYRLLEGTSIRVYRFGSDYSGPYDVWLRFSDQVDDRSGIVLLNVYAVPAGKRTSAAGGGGGDVLFSVEGLSAAGLLEP